MTTSSVPTRLSRVRFALVVLLGAYPVITALLYVIVPLTAGWGIWQRTLVIAPVMVGAMIWGLIPFVHRHFQEFIHPPVKLARKLNHPLNKLANDKKSGNVRLPSQARWALATLSLSMLLSALGTSIANVGLPTLAHAFNVTFQEVQWVVLAYLLAITTLIVSVGRLGDLIGRRRLLLGGLMLFTVASVLIGLAPTFELLIAGRVGQGLGAAVMMALTMAFVGEMVPKERVGSAMGLLGTTSAVGTALGPSIGGFLISIFDWPSIFFLNGALGVLTLILAYRFLPIDRIDGKAVRPRFDHLGTMLLAVTLAAYALSMTSASSSLGVVTSLLPVIAVVGAGLFLFAETKSSSPLIRLAMFRNSVLSAGFAMSALVTTVVMATLVVGPFYLALALDLEAMKVGLVMACGPFVAALAGVPAGRIVDRLGPYRMTISGLVGMAVGALALVIVPASAGVPGYVIPLALITAGYALFQAANNTAVMADISPDQRGVTSGLLNLSRNLGLVTGASAMGKVFALGAGTSSITSAPASAIVGGMHATFAVAGILILVALGIGIIGQLHARRHA